MCLLAFNMLAKYIVMSHIIGIAGFFNSFVVTKGLKIVKGCTPYKTKSFFLPVLKTLKWISKYIFSQTGFHSVLYVLHLFITSQFNCGEREFQSSSVWSPIIKCLSFLSDTFGINVLNSEPHEVIQNFVHLCFSNLMNEVWHASSTYVYELNHTFILSHIHIRQPYIAKIQHWCTVSKK